MNIDTLAEIYIYMEYIIPITFIILVMVYYIIIHSKDKYKEWKMNQTHKNIRSVYNSPWNSDGVM